MEVLELTQKQADQIGTPFTCDVCEAWVNRGDPWSMICMPDRADKELKVMLLCELCYEKLVPIFREFFHIPVPENADAHNS